MADRFGEIAQVFFFCETGELGDVVEADVEEALDAGVREAGKELLGGLFGEADGENSHLLSHEFRTRGAASPPSFEYTMFVMENGRGEID